MKLTRISLLLTLVVLLGFPGTALASLYDEIQASLICPACIAEGMTVASCGDDTAEKTRQEIKQLMNSGESKEQIIERYVKQYGNVILAVPSKKGFDLMAWIIPPVIILGATLAIFFTLKRWVFSKQTNKSMAQQQKGIDASSEERLSEEIRKYI